MKVRRKSPVCAAIRTDGTATILYKGKAVTVKADYRVVLPDGGSAVFQNLFGFRVVQDSPLLVQQVYPVEEAVQWNKHGDHPRVRRLTPADPFHKHLVDNGFDPADHGIMVNHVGHPNPIYPGDYVVGNEGCEVRRYQEDMQHYEVV